MIALSGAVFRAGKALSEEGLVSAWKALDAIKASQEKPIEKAFADILRKQQTETLRRWEIIGAAQVQANKAVTPEDKILGDLVFDIGSWLDELLEEIGPLALESMKEGFRTGGLAINTSTDFILSPRAEQEMARVLKLIEGTSETTRNNLGRIIKRGMDKGDSVDDIANSIKKVYTSWTDARAKLVAQTTVTPTFEVGQQEVWLANDVESNMWLSMRDAKVREAHRPGSGVDGEVVKVGEPFSNGLEYPQEPNCFPAGTRVSAGSILGVIRSWYEGPLVTVKTEGGCVLTGTPNHPVLTQAGFASLSALNEGSGVICGGFSQPPLPVEGDVENVPTVIEEVYDSLCKIGTQVRTRGAQVNLYGRTPDGDVDIVWADGFLEGTRETPAFHPPREHALALSHESKVSLFGDGLFNGIASMDGGRSVAPSIIGGGNEALSFVGGRLIHPELLGRASSPSLNAVLLKPQADHVAAHTEGFSESILGLSRGVAGGYLGRGEDDVAVGLDPALDEPPVDGLDLAPIADGYRLDRFTSPVTLDHVRDISVRNDFAGHVYTLITREGIYNAEGVLVKNCRCVLLPVGVKDIEPEAKGWRAERDEKIRLSYPTLKVQHGADAARDLLAEEHSISVRTVERAIWR